MIMPFNLISGEWRKLVMINYEVDPDVLMPLIPNKTTLNFYKGKCFVTLAGFMFNNIKITGIALPFHQQVDEINLRFYVIPEGAEQTERGVVFIKELIPKKLIASSANFLYQEHYEVTPVKHIYDADTNCQEIQYAWKADQQNSIHVTAGKKAYEINNDTEEEFITLQLRGYTKVNEQKTFRYVVQHPLWHLYAIEKFNMTVDFKNSFGIAFEFLQEQKPSSIYLAEGSPITIEMRENF
jgi:uncharacterized protein